MEHEGYLNNLQVWAGERTAIKSCLLLVATIAIDNSRLYVQHYLVWSYGYCVSGGLPTC